MFAACCPSGFRRVHVPMSLMFDRAATPGKMGHASRDAAHMIGGWDMSDATIADTDRPTGGDKE